MPITPKCLIKTCGKPPAVNSKGLCLKCYSQAKKLVLAGSTTWEDLISKGLAQEEETPFMKAFKESK